MSFSCMPTCVSSPSTGTLAFSDRYLRRLEEIMRYVCADWECELRGFNGEANRVRLLANLPPNRGV